MSTAKKKSLFKKLELREHTSENLHLLLESIEGISRINELDSLLTESMEAARLVMDSEASSLMLLDEKTGELFISLPTGPAKNEIKGKRIPKDKGIGGWVIKHSKPFKSNNPKQSEFFWGDVSEEFSTRNIICVPLVNTEGRAIGVLQALNKRKNKDFSLQDIAVLQSLASHVTIAIERAQDQEKMSSRLRYNDALLTEVNHRIKNNLASISGLVEMEIEKVESEYAKDVLKDTYSRIRSMTEVHNLLSRKGYSDEIDLGKYFRQLSEKISETLSHPSTRVNIQINAETIFLASEKAMTCGLVFNELLINVYKHAFVGLDEGRIEIDLFNLPDNKIQLNVKDNGVGISDDFDLEDSHSVGTWVINVLLRKLNASVEIDNSEGTRFSIVLDK